MSITWQGFHVRPPRPEETPVLAEWFAGSPLGTQGVIYLGAFGQPDDVPLGAVALRPFKTLVDARDAASFLIFVRPDCRRRRIGTTLMQGLKLIAEKNNAHRLELADLVHEDSPDNAFYRATGMSVVRRLNTYVVTCERARKLCEPLVRRCRARGHPHLTGTRIVPVAQLNLPSVAEFIAAQYGGFVDHCLAELSSGKIDLEISHACLAGEAVVAGAFFRTRPGAGSTLFDLILTAPSYREEPSTGLRTSPLPFAMIAAADAVASACGIRECVFESDAQHDRFAVGFATRAGATVKSCRNRYAILRERENG